MIGEILAYFGDDIAFRFLRKLTPQIAKNFRRRHDGNLAKHVGRRGFIKLFGNRRGEALLLQFVSVPLFDGAANLANARIGPPGRTTSLFARWRIGVFQHRQVPEIGKFFVSLIDQKQSLLAIARKDPGGRTGKTTKMWCAVLNREGATLLIKATDTGESPGPDLQTDAWRASIEIALGKAYTAVSLSSNDQALDSKTVGLATRIDRVQTFQTSLAQPIGPPGTNNGPGPFWGLGNTNPFQGSPGSAAGSPALNTDNSVPFNHRGIVTFAGGQPVYSSSTGKLLGGVGVGGDDVDQDDAVAKGAVTGAGFCLSPTGTGCRTLK